MNKYLLILPFIFISLLETVSVVNSHEVNESEKSIIINQKEAQDLLKNLYESINNKNYSLLYSFSYMNATENTFSYQHAIHNKQRYVLLINLDNQENFIINKNDQVYYLANKLKIQANHIIDNLPSIFNFNYEAIKNNYNANIAGKVRLSNRIGTVVNLVNKNSNLYYYNLVIDDKTNLLLSSVEINKDNNQILSRFKAININIDDNPTWINEININDKNFKELTNNTLNSNEKEVKDLFNKKFIITFIPQGFQLKKINIVDNLALNIDKDIQNKYYSLLYSDGLYNFNIYASVDSSDNYNNHYYWSNNDTNLYVDNFNKNEIFIIGNIPLSTMKQILDSISLTDISQQRIINKSYGYKLTIVPN